MSAFVTLLAERLNAIVHHPVGRSFGISYINMVRFFWCMTATTRYRTLRVYEEDYLRINDLREKLWKNNKDLRGMSLSCPWLFHQMMETVFK